MHRAADRTGGAHPARQEEPASSRRKTIGSRWRVITGGVEATVDHQHFGGDARLAGLSRNNATASATSPSPPCGAAARDRDRLQDAREPGNARGRQRLDRSGRDRIDADVLRPEIGGEISHSTLRAPPSPRPSRCSSGTRARCRDRSASRCCRRRAFSISGAAPRASAISEYALTSSASLNPRATSARTGRSDLRAARTRRHGPGNRGRRIRSRSPRTRARSARRR